MQTPVSATAPFQRVVVGIDGSELALQACRFAARLSAPSGQLIALAVAETAAAVHTGVEAPAWAARLHAEAVAASGAVVETLDDPRVRTEVVTGRAAEKLLQLAHEQDAELIALGPGTARRATGVLLGSVTTRLIHEAPCSVLVARGDQDADSFPQRILVGLDGSEMAADAGALAEQIAASTGAQLRRLVATGGQSVTTSSPIEAQLDARTPVEALTGESADSDLVVVGSRGLTGVAALGSVAERVAHAAKCSVLIVRRAGRDR